MSKHVHFVEDHVNLPVFPWGRVFSDGEGCCEQEERLQNDNS